MYAHIVVIKSLISNEKKILKNEVQNQKKNKGKIEQKHIDNAGTNRIIKIYIRFTFKSFNLCI